ncbi:hypothetical protein QVD17_25442 [Tagetes erecta]|uniref:C3H1-type domain-containing protein n=1 Tax=Tagetes erecta TaxID=13708 RepID=A0AAD8KJP7_TARER|nr:hypothetical protein QVD17_25442 [Tagetes erecta]
MWFFQKLRCSANSFETKSELNNQQQQQQYPDSQLQSDSSIIDDNKLVQLVAQDLENLVLSCNDEVIDRCVNNQSVLVEEADQVKEEVDEAESKVSSEEKSLKFNQFVVDEVVERFGVEKVLEADPKECRVLEERDGGESEIGCGNQEDEADYGDDDSDEKVCELKDGDLKEKRQIEIEDGDVSSEIGGNEDNSENAGGKSKDYHYPLRPDAVDCSFYTRTGTCKFGSSCRFNHPLRRKNQPAKETKKQKEENVERRSPIECKQPPSAKETKKQKEENVERRGKIECKHHASSAGCKYGKACKFNHGRRKTVKTPVVEYNFVGLPIRPGEKECPYYMRRGSCKYGPSCRFNHPDPTAVGDGDAPTSYGNDGPLPLQHPPQPNIPNMPSWSAPRPPEPTASFVPMMYPPTQNIPSPSPDWNGYQAPAPVPTHLYPSSEQGLPIPPAFFLNNPPANANLPTHYQQPMLVSEYPERPGQPDCSYFMKTGDCKYRATCKFNHPQSRTTRTSRDHNICTYFSRHGTCKYGSACEYDHPVNYNSNSNPAREGYDGSNGPNHTIQQSV